jgi:hypothetical protein
MGTKLTYFAGKILQGYSLEKCLVVHSIPLLSMWTNNVKKIGSHYTLSTISYIIGLSTQECNRSRMRMYNQEFLYSLTPFNSNQIGQFGNFLSFPFHSFHFFKNNNNNINFKIFSTFLCQINKFLLLFK